MAQSTTAAGTPSKKGAKRAAGRSSGAADTFKLADHLESVETLSWDDLMLDTKLEKGQVRPVEHTHVCNLVQHYDINEPFELELTVHLDQGVAHCPCRFSVAKLPLSSLPQPSFPSSCQWFFTLPSLISPPKGIVQWMEPTVVVTSSMPFHSCACLPTMQAWASM